MILRTAIEQPQSAQRTQGRELDDGKLLTRQTIEVVDARAFVFSGFFVVQPLRLG